MVRKLLSQRGKYPAKHLTQGVDFDIRALVDRTRARDVGLSPRAFAKGASKRLIRGKNLCMPGSCLAIRLKPDVQAHQFSATKMQASFFFQTLALSKSLGQHGPDRQETLSQLGYKQRQRLLWHQTGLPHSD